MSGKTEDVFDELAEQIRNLREELGLSLLPFETIPDTFSKMSKDLLKKLEPHTGPIYRDKVAGFLAMKLEMIGKQNEDLGRLAIEENQWVIDHIKVRDVGKLTIQNMKTALDTVDELVAVLEEHGEEKAEEVGRFLRRQITHQVCVGYYLRKLPGAQNNLDSAAAVVQQIIPLLSHQPEAAIIEAELIDLGYGLNGRHLTEKESPDE